MSHSDNKEPNAIETVAGKNQRTVVDDHAPYSNVSVGVIGVLFGPIAGGILSYISLKNLGQKHAKYMLISSIVISVIFAYILMFLFPDTANFQLGFLWLGFMYFQLNYVKKWAEENPEKKYRSPFKAFLWGVVGIISFLAISSAILLVFIPSGASERTEIQVDYPSYVEQDQEFLIQVSAKNMDDKNHAINYIDLENILSKGMNLKGLELRPDAAIDQMFGFHSYKFDTELPANSTVNFSLEGVASTPGIYEGIIGFCIDSDLDCLYYEINLYVR